jgi:hypothetical protein
MKRFKIDPGPEELPVPVCAFPGQCEAPIGQILSTGSSNRQDGSEGLGNLAPSHFCPSGISGNNPIAAS